MPVIIIIDEMHPGIIPQLESLGYQVDYQPEITRQQLKAKLQNYQGLILRSKTEIDRELLQLATNLQFVARAGAGVDNLDHSELAARGLHIINAPEGNRDSLGEHMVGMLLSLLHRISRADTAIRTGIWDRERFRGTELSIKTLGIIGCGNMGRAFAKRLKSFDCQVLGYDKYFPDQNSTDFISVPIEELYARADILSLHVPLTSETRGFYNYSFFQQFEKPILLLNSARGEVLPLSDLVRSMKEGKITGAGLDVFEKEPFYQLSDIEKDTYEFLLESPSVLMTPHVAGWSHQSYQRINDVLVQKIRLLKQSGAID